MGRRHVSVRTGLVLAGIAMIGAIVLRDHGATRASNGPVIGPLPPPVQTKNTMPLTMEEQLGKDIGFDHTLSYPAGYACFTCHTPETGFTGPSSEVNALLGTSPGVRPGRFGRRKAQSIPYVAFCPPGPYYDDDLEIWLGGTFWDGRTPDTAHQARMPFLDPNEMANVPVGPYPPVAGGISNLVAVKLKANHSALFKQVFGADVFNFYGYTDLYGLATKAIAAYEASAEINPFNSKYDASAYGTPPSNQYVLSPSEENGRVLYFGKAQCSQCHSSAPQAVLVNAAQGKELFTMYCYANIGVPKNPNNPFYTVTDPTNPGRNALGYSYVDYGMGANPNQAPGGQRFMNVVPGDIPEFRGLFKVPSLRNVDKRPYPSFVKAYMHNGVFKSLAQVVRFYNKRNIAADRYGNEVSFDLRFGPPHGFTPLLAPPEVLDNVQNVEGAPPGAIAPPNASGGYGQVGNLGLTASEENDLVNFMTILTDGFTKPRPVVHP